MSGGEDGVLYDVGGCDEDQPQRGPRMYVSSKHYHAANSDSRAPVYWAFEETDDTPFPIPGLLVLRGVCWLQVECVIRLPSPPVGQLPYRYRVYWRLGVSEKSNLGGPRFSVGPVEQDAPFASEVSRVVYNDHLRRLIDLPYTHIPGVGDEQPPAFIPQPTEAAEAERIEEPERRPRNQGEMLMNGRPHWMRRPRRTPIEDRQGQIRPERVMRELIIGEVEVRAKETAANEAGRSGGKEEKEEGEEKTRVTEHGQGCGDVRVWVRCLKIGNSKQWKNNVAFDCIIAERVTY